jgi:hypothetical protein
MVIHELEAVDDDAEVRRILCKGHVLIIAVFGAVIRPEE